ncbi:4Fe-4S binding protein [Mesobacillus sp. AQ2]|uniref:4Fe-4S dicluster domain-containing protein n=1 Tax=unclassified Mesobacillus TaxID=2675270 RepID=UPI00203C8FD0|nr:MULTISPECIES: 4Fe-4S dicluster domain-containing protein [unclassified Mesobacillus]MCM3124965.1 4Fe-4S binding protein [Mesobacillus sp. MER 33]MCM3235275.1 4Fe-4S binding protein [Mesobacillus sp. MER 48]WHX39794.1 4Fe-4S binding protein [Mesobacillus sp. AQ2]
MGVVGNWLESLDFEYKISDGCVRGKSKKATCTTCVDSCPETGAIVISDRIPYIQPDLCKECGDCIAACPVHAIEGVFPKRHVKAGKLLAYNGSKPSVSELLIHSSKGIQSILPQEPLDEVWLERIQAANNLLLDMEKNKIELLPIKSINLEEETVSRRELFTMWGKGSKKLAKDVTPASWRFNHKKLELAPYYPDFQFNQVEINSDTCTLCRTCERLCPKQCFELNEAGFRISSQACSSCMLCVDSCPEQAISVKERVSKATTMNIEIYQHTCSVCKKPFKTLHRDEEKCSVCSRIKEGYLSSRTC